MLCVYERRTPIVGFLKTTCFATAVFLTCGKLALICRVINHAAQTGAECGLFETLSEITHLDWLDGNICCSKLLNMLSINLLFPGKKVHMFILLFFKEYSLFCALHLFSLSELTLQFDNSAIVYILFVYFCYVTVILEMERHSNWGRSFHHILKLSGSRM